MSCTESIGFESSDEISTVDFACCCCCCSVSRNNVDDSSSFLPSSSSRNYSTPMKELRSENRSEINQFPPPLTTMNQNGRRNFILRSERKDGRLEIVKVVIERPEFLYASRQNGRLTMHFVRTVPQHDYEQDQDQEQEQEDEKEEEREEEEITGEMEEKESMEESAMREKEEEREWKIPAAGIRRCYEYDKHVWGQQQRRWVTTIM